MNDEFACECGMPTIATPAFPDPYTPEWHVLHAKVHHATFKTEKELCDA